MASKIPQPPNPLFLMVQHKPMCWIVNLLVFIGALNWGLVGLGGLLNMDLNVVNMILGSLPTVEWIVYLLVGIAGLMMGYMFLTAKSCGCQSMDKMDMKK